MRASLTYVVSKEAWYASSSKVAWKHYQTDEVVVSRSHYTEDGVFDGVSWEFEVNWYKLTGDLTAPKLEAFDEAWEGIFGDPEMVPLTEWMAKAEAGITPAEFTAKLDELGFVDQTERVQPEPGGRCGKYRPKPFVVGICECGKRIDKHEFSVIIAFLKGVIA